MLILFLLNSNCAVMNKTYNFRFIPEATKVYFICKRPLARSNQITLYSEPFYSKERKEQSNALIAYQNPVSAAEKLVALKEDSAVVASDDLLNLQYLSILLNMPLIVELSYYCDIADANTEYVDVFYFQAKKL